MENNSENKLQRKMGMVEATTVGVGLVVGVGIFTVGSSAVGVLTGGRIIIATILAFVITLLACLVYGEMGAAMPHAGGTYVFTKRALGGAMGSVAGWNFLISTVGASSAEALAFANYFSWIFKGAGHELNVDVRVIAGILALFFIIINYFGVELSSKVQNGFVFFFWGASILWMIYMIRYIDLDNFVGFTDLGETFAIGGGFKGFLALVCLVWWCFAGFEMPVGMGGEIKHPKKNIPHAMILIPILVLAVNALFQWYLTGLVPFDKQPQLADAAAPYAEGLAIAGLTGFPIILLALAISMGGDMSTMNPGIGGTARYIYAMSEDGVFPKFFGKIHPKHKTPYVAIIVTAVIDFLLILTNSIEFIAMISVISIFWVYVLGIISFLVLHKNEPNMHRPYKVKYPWVVGIASLICFLLLIWSSGWQSIGISFGITAVALVFYFAYGKKRSVSKEELIRNMDEEAAMLEEEELSQEEEKKLDKNFKVWLGISSVVACLGVLLFIIGFAH